MRYPWLFLLAFPLAAQVVTIDAGSSTDRGFAGGYAFTSTALAALPAPYRDLRAGASFAYDLSVPNGTCSVTLQMVENRPAGSDPAQNSAPGSRLFTVTANGVSTEPLDLFVLAGPLTPYDRVLGPVSVTDGHLRVTLSASKGNASLSGLRADCTPTPVPPFRYDSANNVWIFTGNMRTTGYSETGAPGQPTHIAVTDSAGKVCDLSFSGGKPVLTCP